MAERQREGMTLGSRSERTLSGLMRKTTLLASFSRIDQERTSACSRRFSKPFQPPSGRQFERVRCDLLMPEGCA
jgi:hypothetical protein